MPSDAAHTITTSTNNNYQQNPTIGGGSVSNYNSQACISFFAITAKRFAVSSGCFHPGNSPFAMSQLAGVTAALALRETKIWLAGGSMIMPCEIQHELQKETKKGLY